MARILLAIGLAAALIVPMAPAAHAADKSNSFNRPSSGTPYTLSEWNTDGWYAPWQQGMGPRTMIDGSISRSGKSLRVFYPQGKFGPDASGAQAPFTVSPAREYWLRQWVRLSPDFSWGIRASGGKLGAGLAGGARCSGGTACNGYNGFTSRFAWGSGGRAYLYFYHMGNTGQYGDSLNLTLGGSQVYYPRGQWFELVQRVRVNTVSGGNANYDGEVEVWFNGQNAGRRTGLQFVRNGDLVNQVYFSSFYGGATADFAPANNSYAWYDDLRAATFPI